MPIPSPRRITRNVFSRRHTSRDDASRSDFCSSAQYCATQYRRAHANPSPWPNVNGSPLRFRIALSGHMEIAVHDNYVRGNLSIVPNFNGALSRYCYTMTDAHAIAYHQAGAWR